MLRLQGTPTLDSAALDNDWRDQNRSGSFSDAESPAFRSSGYQTPSSDDGRARTPNSRDSRGSGRPSGDLFGSKSSEKDGTQSPSSSWTPTRGKYKNAVKQSGMLPIFQCSNPDGVKKGFPAGRGKPLIH
eukprot:TRINITY_DN9393_c1_g1_i4.p1 TRINITY_DN9393_c1_g1~~TRINITY_DN9393_c1_g1_i4.p1  ORF type:complete len:130 (+),score=0.09 TRINITY_DN9393_c1_g1_i4:276-665(+)